MSESLGLNTFQDEWIQSSLFAVSPFGDFVAVGSGQAVVMYTKRLRPGTNTQIFQITRTYQVLDEEDRISAIGYLPVVSGKAKMSQDVWHCVLLGYASGFIECVAADTGQVLVRKQFCPNKVVSRIRYLRQCPSPNISGDPLTAVLSVPKLKELLIIHGGDGPMVAVESNALFSTLSANRAEVNRLGLSSSEDNYRLSNLTAKKLILNSSSATEDGTCDAVGFSKANVAFDQLNMMSMSKEFLSQDHLKSLSSVTNYVVVGSNPVFQVVSPHNFAAGQNVNELASTVVSTVKSGLFRVAGAGLSALWGGGTDQPKETPAPPPPDPEVKLSLRHMFKDVGKSASSIEISPDERYSAVVDDQNRVLLLDNHNGGIVTHVWKGYHRAQVGWITTSWDARRDTISSTGDKVPNDLETSVLLVIYLPRRGLLEVWSPERKFRVTEFKVSKSGRLVTTPNVFLDSARSSQPWLRAFECALLDPCGSLFQIYVPIHALTNKACSHDSTLQKQILAVLGDESLTEVTAEEKTLEKLVEMLKSVKSTVTKISLMLQVFKWRLITILQCKEMLREISEQLTENEVATSYCELIGRSLDFYGFLAECPPQRAAEEMKDALSCSTYECDVIDKILCDNAECDDPIDFPMLPETFPVHNFFECVTVKTEHMNSSDENDARLHLKATCEIEILVKFLQHLLTACKDQPEETMSHLKSVGLDGKSLMAFVFQTCFHQVWSFIPFSFL